MAAGATDEDVKKGSRAEVVVSDEDRSASGAGILAGSAKWTSRATVSRAKWWLSDEEFSDW